MFIFFGRAGGRRPASVAGSLAKAAELVESPNKRDTGDVTVASDAPTHSRGRPFICLAADYTDMDVREAVEADADRMADIAGSPPDVMRNLVHDRTVRVACEEGDDEGVVGLVSFDASDRTVHVTQLAGTTEACVRLLDEPIRFAEREGMNVELLVTETDEPVREAVEQAGFQDSGAGPRFEGEPTTRYRLEPNRAEQ